MLCIPIDWTGFFIRTVTKESAGPVFREPLQLGAVFSPDSAFGLIDGGCNTPHHEHRATSACDGQGSMLNVAALDAPSQPMLEVTMNHEYLRPVVSKKVFP